MRSIVRSTRHLRSHCQSSHLQGLLLSSESRAAAFVSSVSRIHLRRALAHSRSLYHSARGSIKGAVVSEASPGGLMTSERPAAVKRVLSIQSHVVHGYVGNKCCVFPLQVLGYDVDPICSVQFSNHTGYKSWKGTVTTAEQLWDLVEGLKTNDLLQYSHLVTGYIGSVGLLETIQRVVRTLRAANPDLVYVCDPVLGDDGRLYLPGEMVRLYRDRLVQLATVLTPNQFEAEQLTGNTIRTEHEALQACQDLLERGPSTVVLTSFAAEGVTDQLSLIAATKEAQKQGSYSALKIRIPKLGVSFTGTGDLLSALLLARLDQFPDDLKKAVELATASLQGILAATFESLRRFAVEEDPLPTAMRKRELRLIPNQHLLRDPEIRLRAEELLVPAERSFLG